jgi:hypothetical protein
MKNPFDDKSSDFLALITAERQYSADACSAPDPQGRP